MFWEYNNETSKRQSKKQIEKEYEEYLDDPLTFALDEALGILGPHNEKIN